MKSKKIDVTESSGNVFLDLGFPPEEAQNLLMRRINDESARGHSTTEIDPGQSGEIIWGDPAEDQ